jgi:N-acetylmuramoyl-L-alanine amidase
VGRWTDIATWRGPTGNQGGPMVAHRGVVLHIAEGNFEGTIAWCLNGNSGVSAHFVVARDGRIAQLVDTETQSWCQAAGNAEWLSIENEGYSGEELTTDQLAACTRIFVRAHTEHDVPLENADSPDGYGLGHHSMGGALWGGHSLCPGTAIIAQKPEIIVAAQRVINPIKVDIMEEDVKVLMRYDKSPHVFLTDGTLASWVTSEDEIADRGTMSREKSLPLGYDAEIRIVTRRELVGWIVGDVPDGWEDRAVGSKLIDLTDEQVSAIAMQAASIIGFQVTDLKANLERLSSALGAAGAAQAILGQ